MTIARRFRTATLLALVGATGPAAAPAAAPPPQRLGPRVTLEQTVAPGRDGMVTVFVELAGEPSARVYARSLRSGLRQAAAAASSARATAANAAQQQLLRSRVAALGAVELYPLQRLLNGLVVRVDPRRVSQLAALPRVQRVVRAPRHTLDTATSVPFIGGNAAWDGSGALGTLGLTGAGVSIAVIDTGIDYLHANFGGDTSSYGQQVADVTGSDGVPFPTAKVVAGRDFAGDAYDADGASGSPTPVPDPDPTDCNGHGSHVAGIAAGTGVDGGATWTGGYDDLPASALADFEIGPGVAPAARLVALKVFGCSGSTDLVLAALEHAVDPNGDGELDDRYDVVNLSLGSPYGFGHYEAAVDNAVAAGMVVVGTAGNAGDVHYVTGGPGSAAAAISVASSVDDSPRVPAVEVDLDGDDLTDATYDGLHQPWSEPLTGPVPAAHARLEAPSQPLGCNAADFAGFTAGRVAWIERGTCSGKLKVRNAESAGASAVVIVATNTVAPAVLADDPLVPDVDIPAVMISGPFGAAIASGGLDEARLTPAGSSLADALDDFSSRGPRRRGVSGSLVVKPDLAAPGHEILSTATCYRGDGCAGNEAAALSGTSMAAPHVAGVMALLRQRHPTWSVAELKALALSTANHDVANLDLVDGPPGPRHGTSRAGAGRVDVRDALASPAFAHGTEDPAAVSLAFAADVLPGTPIVETRSVTVTNRGGSAVTYALAIDTIGDVPGVAFSVSPSSITVPALSTRAVDVTVSYDATAMTHELDVTSAAQHGDKPRHWISEETGLLTLTPTAGASTALRVALYAAGRPASAMSAPAAVATEDATGLVTIPLTGTHVLNGAGAERYRSLVTGFQLLHRDPERQPGPDGADGSDLRFVGASSDVPLGGSRSYLGIAMWGPWDTPAVREIRYCLDLDQDGTELDDGIDWCFVTYTRRNTDVHRVGLVDVNGWLGAGQGAVFDWEPANFFEATTDTRLFDNDVALLVAPTSPAFWLDLLGSQAFSSGADGAQAFDFYVETRHFDDSLGDVVDVTPRLTFDPANAPLSPAEGTAVGGVAMVPLVPDLDATGFDFAYDLTDSGYGDVELLLLHHYNVAGERAQVVTLDGPFDDGPAALTVTPTSPPTTTEAGGTATFTVALATAPTASVTVTVASSDPTEGTAGTGSLVFTGADWDDPQTVTVTGVDDLVGDGDQPYTVTLAVDAAATGDSRYDELAPVAVQLTNLDSAFEGTFFTLTPCRLLDTRTPAQGPALASGAQRAVPARGACGIPATARAVAINLTVTAAPAAGTLAAWAGGDPVPEGMLPFGPGRTRANHAVVRLSPAGELVLAPTLEGGGAVHLLVDVSGYFE